MRTFVSAPLPSNVTMLLMFAGMRVTAGLAVATMLPTKRFYYAFFFMLILYNCLNLLFLKKNFVKPVPLSIDAAGNVFVMVTCLAGAAHLRKRDGPTPKKKSSKSSKKAARRR